MNARVKAAAAELADAIAEEGGFDGEEAEGLRSAVERFASAPNDHAVLAVVTSNDLAGARLLERRAKEIRDGGPLRSGVIVDKAL